MLDKKALLETLKSFARFVYFFLLGALVTALVTLAATPQVMALTITVAGMTVPLGSLLAMVIAGLAKLLDRYVRANQNIDANGIAPEFLQR